MGPVVLVGAGKMGLAVSDYDGNGTLDLFFTNSGYNAGPTKLLSNDGDGTFTDVSERTGAALGSWAWGSNFLDADLDGRPDIYVAVGFSELVEHAVTSALPDDPVTVDMPSARTAIRDGSMRALDDGKDPPWGVVDSTAPRTNNDRLLVQEPDGTFTEVVLGPTAKPSGATWGSAIADYDGDGRPDVVVGNLDGGYRLLRNRGEVGTDNQPLVVELRGDGSAVNRDAVGARATLTRNDGRSQTAVVTVGGSLGSGNDLPLLFGLGTTAARDLVVEWPDGTATTVSGAELRGRVVVAYGEKSPVTEPLSAGR